MLQAGSVDYQQYLYICLAPRNTLPLLDHFSASELWWLIVCINLPRPWYLDFDQVSKWNEVAQLCLALCDPEDYSPPGSSIHGILQARILEWVAISFSRGSSWPRDWTQVSRITGRRFNLWATREAGLIHRNRASNRMTKQKYVPRLVLLLAHISVLSFCLMLCS